MFFLTRIQLSSCRRAGRNTHLLSTIGSWVDQRRHVGAWLFGILRMHSCGSPFWYQHNLGSHFMHELMKWFGRIPVRLHPTQSRFTQRSLPRRTIKPSSKEAFSHTEAFNSWSGLRTTALPPSMVADVPILFLAHFGELPEDLVVLERLLNLPPEKFPELGMYQSCLRVILGGWRCP